jgi:3',5'-cyclic AMP phosphodiesterase CpdA
VSARNRRIRLGCVNLAFAAALLCAFLAASASAEELARKLDSLRKLPPKFSFVVLGDTRAGDPAADGIYRQLIASAMQSNPDLILNTGDEIDKPGSTECWERFWDLSKNVTIPYFLTVGNHDIHPAVAGSEDIYRRQVELPGNELYYSFVAGNALFAVLDSNLRGEEKRITDGQFRWLEALLASSKEKHRFVFIHHPLFPETGTGKHAGNSLDRYRDDRNRLHLLFVKYRVTAVFAGHEHLYLRKTIDGIVYIITGGGGAPLYAQEEEGGFHHYVRMTVDGDQVAGEVVDVNGRIRDRF